MSQNPLVRWPTYTAYAAPYIAVAWFMAPVSVVQGIYAKYYAIPLTTIAAVILIARLFDAITDPLIGYYSDRYYQRTGTRKPFIIAGGLLFMVSSYFLYLPPVQATALYFTVWFMAVYLGWTLLEIPHTAWGGELAPTSQDKAKIFSFRSIASYSGTIAFYAIPLLPFLDSSEITPETLKISVIAASVLMLPCLYACIKKVPDSARPGARASKQTLGLLALLHTIITNKPFLLFIAAMLCNNIATGMWFGLIFIFVDAYLGLGEQFAKMFMLAFVVGVLATPVWCKIAQKIGNKQTWLLAMSLAITSFIYTATLSPGDTRFEELLILKTIQTLGFSCMGFVLPAMLSEIINYSAWKFNTESSAATYFSLYAFLAKATHSIAMALGLGIAGWYGFDPASASHDSDSIEGLTFAIAWGPLIFASLALVFIALSPISTRRHTVIRQRLDLRAARAAANISS